MAVDPNDMNDIRVDVLGTSVDKASGWTMGGPAAGRNALDASITERVPTRLLNGMNVAIAGAEGATNVFGDRFNTVIGDEAGADQTAFDALGTNLIQALAGGVGGSIEFDQATPATTWAITHGLGRKFVSVQLVSDAGNTMWADIDYVDDQDLVVSFAIPKAGTAIVRR